MALDSKLEVEVRAKETRSARMRQPAACLIFVTAKLVLVVAYVEDYWHQFEMNLEGSDEECQC